MGLNILAKHYTIRMPNGEIWSIPVNVIAKHRAKFYASTYYAGDIEKSLRLDTEPLFEWRVSSIEYWAKNHMDWSDVESCAALMSPVKTYYQGGWKNGYCEVL